MVSGLINENPTVYERKERRVRTDSTNSDEFSVEPIDQLEIFDILFFDFAFINSFFCMICIFGWSLTIESTSYKRYKRSRASLFS